MIGDLVLKCAKLPDMERQFTSTVYILNEGKVLLIFHRKYQLWHVPGGHIEPNETPCDAARREAREETGLEIELVQREWLPWHAFPNVRSLITPFQMILGDIPAFGHQPAHQHIDFSYLARPIGGVEQASMTETTGMRWFSREEIAALRPVHDMFPDVHQTLLTLLPNSLS